MSKRAPYNGPSLDPWSKGRSPLRRLAFGAGSLMVIGVGVIAALAIVGLVLSIR